MGQFESITDGLDPVAPEEDDKDDDDDECVYVCTCVCGTNSSPAIRSTVCYLFLPWGSNVNVFTRLL
jgi:hypothetical protein